MRRAVFPLVLGLSVACVLPMGAVAQGGPAAARATTVALAPRLHFSAAEMELANAVAGIPQLASFYGSNGLRTVFQGPDGAPLRAAVRSLDAAAPRHGLPAGRYRSAELDAAGDGMASEILHARVLMRYLRDMTGGALRPSDVSPQIHREVHRPDIAALMRGFVEAPDPAAHLAAVAPQDAAYRALQQALVGSEDLAVPADLPRAPEALWKVGMRGEGLLPLRARLDSIGFSAPSDDLQGYDAALSDAVARYQAAVGLPSDGVAGPNTIRQLNGEGGGASDWRGKMIAVALERMRWMGGEDLSGRHVWVNIPEFTARVREGDHEIFRTRVVVGKTEATQQTPEFSDKMEYLVVNPRWNVPRSITIKEYLPRLKANRYAVSHLDIVDGRGRVVSRDSIDFSRYSAASFPYRMQQKPSDDNALGIVKFIFPNPWNIYLHDTPTKHLFGNRVRAYSHGCVRVGDPVDLATVLLSQQSDDPRGMFDRALRGGRESWLHLTPELPVHLVYFTAYPDETGQVRFVEDVYGRDAAIWDRLQTAGLDLDSEKD